MPRYTYQCLSCEKEWDQVVKAHLRDNIKVCKFCVRDAVIRKVAKKPTVIFKGNGFYITDKGKKS